MEARLAAVVDVINFRFNRIWIPFMILCFSILSGKQNGDVKKYTKRVLDSIEVDFLSSYYAQNGKNAAVSGGIGTEELTDVTPTITISIPMNDDDILKIDAEISAYTSASSSNINPFDGQFASPFQASSGASYSDVWSNVTGTYIHNSIDRNKIYTAKAAVSSEFDYTSFGIGGSFTKLFNDRDSEFSISANIFLDKWNPIYPAELRPFTQGGNGIHNRLFTQHEITGSQDYHPSFSEFNNKYRNSFSGSMSFSQILTKNLQAYFVVDYTRQQGLLSTPFQRVYFSDIADSFIDNFPLADDVERYPGSRNKAAAGTRINYYINEVFILRTYLRQYVDDWGVSSQTANLEIPIKILGSVTIYPSYRYYFQTASDYFAPFNQHRSTDKFYTSDYDLSGFNSDQFGFGLKYVDIFTKYRIGSLGLKSIDVKFSHYERNSGFKANIISCGLHFVLD